MHTCIFPGYKNYCMVFSKISENWQYPATFPHGSSLDRARAFHIALIFITLVLHKSSQLCFYIYIYIYGLGLNSLPDLCGPLYIILFHMFEGLGQGVKGEGPSLGLMSWASLADSTLRSKPTLWTFSHVFFPQ